LGASKLRKFYDYYTENYQRARTDRRLMSSIQMAEDKLQQNDQDVEIFEELRNDLKNANRRHYGRKNQKIKEIDYAISEDNDSIPELSKHQTK
jgi:hypothetical protein